MHNKIGEKLKEVAHNLENWVRINQILPQGKTLKVNIHFEIIDSPPGVEINATSATVSFHGCGERTIDFSTPINELVDGRYALQGGQLREYVSIREEKVLVESAYFYLRKHDTTTWEQVLSEMTSQGFRPATFHEMLLLPEMRVPGIRVFHMYALATKNSSGEFACIFTGLSTSRHMSFDDANRNYSHRIFVGIKQS